MNALALARAPAVRSSRMRRARRGMLAAMEDTMVLQQGTLRTPAPLVPALAAAAVLALLAAGYFAY
ncbi:MAG: hypothetical protein JSR54_06150, partial [Proteobacteria bacterium]|nr:hypothetical protein [Pseudomonadota bacterium]